MQGIDHANFGRGCAAGQNKGKERQSVDFFVCHSIEFGSRLDHRLRDFLRKGVHVAWKDANLECNRSGCCHVIACAHTYFDLLRASASMVLLYA